MDSLYLDYPTAEDLERARSQIVKELIPDFPFVGDADRAHAVALLLLPFVRNLIDGPTPLHLVEKPKAGTGATLLVEMLGFIATGRAISTMAEGKSLDEWHRRITAKLRTGDALVLIDNVRAKLESPQLASAITSTFWEDRKIGSSDMLRLPVRCAWIATGNNPALSDEIFRRMVRIRLDAKTAQPWLGRTFKHSDLRQWVRDHRAELVRSALTLVRGWVVAGRPPATESLGMFEGWSRVIGGILHVAEIPGFLENCEDLYDSADPEDLAWRQFFAEWWGKHQDSRVKVADVFPLAQKCPLDLGKGDDRSQTISLGKKLSTKRDQRFEIDSGGTKLTVCLRDSGNKQNTQVWRLDKV